MSGGSLDVVGTPPFTLDVSRIVFWLAVWPRIPEDPLTPFPTNLNISHERFLGRPYVFLSICDEVWISSRLETFLHHLISNHFVSCSIFNYKTNRWSNFHVDFTCHWIPLLKVAWQHLPLGCCLVHIDWPNTSTWRCRTWLVHRTDSTARDA